MSEFSGQFGRLDTGTSLCNMPMFLQKDFQVALPNQKSQFSNFQIKEKTYRQIVQPILKEYLSSAGESVMSSTQNILQWIISIAKAGLLKLSQAVANRWANTPPATQFLATVKGVLLQKWMNKFGSQFTVIGTSEPLKVSQGGRWQLILQFDQQLNDYLKTHKCQVKKGFQQFGMLRDSKDDDDVMNAAFVDGQDALNYLEMYPEEQISNLQIYNIDNRYLRINLKPQQEPSLYNIKDIDEKHAIIIGRNSFTNYAEHYRRESIKEKSEVQELGLMKKQIENENQVKDEFSYQAEIKEVQKWQRAKQLAMN